MVKVIMCECNVNLTKMSKKVVCFLKHIGLGAARLRVVLRSRLTYLVEQSPVFIELPQAVRPGAVVTPDTSAQSLKGNYQKWWFPFFLGGIIYKHFNKRRK